MPPALRPPLSVGVHVGAAGADRIDGAEPAVVLPAN